jgi:hypothetical protein
MRYHRDPKTELWSSLSNLLLYAIIATILIAALTKANWLVLVVLILTGLYIIVDRQYMKLWKAERDNLFD